MELVDKAAEFIAKGEIKLLWKSAHAFAVQIGDKTVSFKKRQGRTIETCSCENHGRFADKGGSVCSHKLAAATWIVMRRVK